MSTRDLSGMTPEDHEQQRSLDEQSRSARLEARIAVMEHEAERLKGRIAVLEAKLAATREPVRK